ncbi:ABC transporter ATP-binding protein [Streptomyces sp900105245]|uniref:ABC transporter ATP-binding protein n=1 Tax=Streptomyces sp. 900105245 TaxID=3154379 RepID=A0ABV1ULC9_9ACTN
MTAIEVDRISRVYETRTGVLRRQKQRQEALGGVSLHVDRGETYGLLGPNGAGKTTLMKILITLLIPTSGTARILGHDVVKDVQFVRRTVGYVFGGDRGLYERLSAFDNLRYFAELYAVPPRQQRQRIDRLLEEVRLAEFRNERVQGFSRGMRQRLHIARGLLHDPAVIFLDEPSLGIDPVGARELRESIAALSAAGKTIFLTTHYMYEADELCDRISIIRKGTLVAEGTPSELKAKVTHGGLIEITTYGVPMAVIERMRAVRGVHSVVVQDREQAQVILVRADAHTDVPHAIMDHLAGVTVGSIVTRDPTLEDAYVELMAAT